SSSSQSACTWDEPCASRLRPRWSSASWSRPRCPPSHCAAMPAPASLLPPSFTGSLLPFARCTLVGGFLRGGFCHRRLCRLLNALLRALLSAFLLFGNRQRRNQLVLRAANTQFALTRHRLDLRDLLAHLAEFL